MINDEGLKAGWGAKPLDTSIVQVSQLAFDFETKIKALEEKLSEDLSNSRAINQYMASSVSALDIVQRELNNARKSLPRLSKDHAEAKVALLQLEEELPRVRRQIQDVCDAYDSGRIKAKQLAADLSWMTTPRLEQLRRVTFTSNTPVSGSTRIFVRAAVAISTVVTFWFLEVILTGMYRAHSHRLVWGDRLIS